MVIKQGTLHLIFSASYLVQKSHRSHHGHRDLPGNHQNHHRRCDLQSRAGGVGCCGRREDPPSAAYASVILLRAIEEI